MAPVRQRTNPFWTAKTALVCLALIGSFAQVPHACAEPAPDGHFAELWKEIDTGWKAQKQSFNDRMAELNSQRLSPEQARQQAEKIVAEHMTEARRGAAKLNRIYNEACRNTGVKVSVGGDPASRMGRGLAGGDVDLSGTPEQVERFVKELRRLGVPESQLRLMERTPSRVTVNGTMRFTVNYTPPNAEVGSPEHREAIEKAAPDVEHDLSVKMDKNQPGRQFVAVESNIKKGREGFGQSPAELLKGGDPLQGSVKGALKNINLSGLSEADIKISLRRNGIAETPDQVVEMMQKIKSQGGHLAPDKLYGLDEAKMEKFQRFLQDVNGIAEWKTLQQAERQMGIARDIRRDLAASDDLLVRQQIKELDNILLDSRLRMEAQLRENQGREMDRLRLARNAKAHEVDTLREKGPSEELDRATKELNEMTERIAERGRQHAAVRRTLDSQMKSVGEPAEPNQGARGGTQSLVMEKTGFFSTEVRPSIRWANKAAGAALAGISGLDEYEKNRRAGHGITYSAAGAGLKTGVMLNPLGVVYFAPEASWNSAKVTADTYIHDAILDLERSGRPITREELERIAREARIKGTIVGVGFGTAVVSQIAPILFPAGTTAGTVSAFASPIGLVVLAGGAVWSKYEPIRRDRKLVEWNQAEQLEQIAEVLRFGHSACSELMALATEIDREAAALESLVGRAENGERAYELYRKRFADDSAYIERVNRRIDTIRTALLRGTLDPAADGKLYAEFEAVKDGSDEISTTVDELIAGYKAGTVSHDTIRERHTKLLGQFHRIQDRYASARRTFNDFRILADLPNVIEGYNLVRDRAGKNLLLARNLSEQLLSIGEGVPDRATTLAAQVQEFNTRKSTLLRGLERALLRNRKRDEAQDRELESLLDVVRGLKIKKFQASDFQVAGSGLRQTADYLRLLADAKLPEAVSFQGLERFTAAARTAVLDLTKVAADALVALERARKQLDRLAALVESPPPQTVQKPPPQGPYTPLPPDSPPRQPPPIAPGVASIRETAKNVFVVEMNAMPQGARFVWDFGDGSRTQTGSPQVQHNYVAPTGGISGLAGKKWQLSVTIYAGGRTVGSATYTVSRGRLSDSPIQKGPPQNIHIMPPPGIMPPRR